MQNINKNGVIPILLVWVISMMLFRVNDPYKLQLLVLLFCLPFIKTVTVRKLSWIDSCVLIIWALDIISCMISNRTISGVELSYNTTLGVVSYILARNIFSEESCKILFFKIVCLPIGFALCFSILSFIFFEHVLENVGFSNIYPFRYLFSPLGHITNVWSAILFSLLGILSLSYYILRERVWKCITGLLLYACVTSILLSFSRGAYISLCVYIFICVLFIPSYIEKIKIIFGCMMIVGTIYMFFPKEVTTTIRMNQTTLQQQSNEGRLDAIQAALKVYKYNSNWFGLGIGSYTSAVDHELNQNSMQKYTSYAPNIILQLIIEKGIIGVSVYVVLFIAVCLKLWKQRKDFKNIIVGGIFIAICIKELTISVMLVSPLLLCLCYILLASVRTNSNIIETSSNSNKAKYLIIAFCSFFFISYETFFMLYSYNEKRNKESMAALKKGKYTEAIHAMECTSEWTPYLINRTKLYMNCYEKLLLPEYLTKAQQALSQAQKRNPDDVYLDYLYAKLLILKKDHANAYCELKKVVDAYPQNVLYKFTLCKLLCDTRQSRTALPYLKEILLISPRLLNMQTIEKLKQVDIPLYCDIIFWLKQQIKIKNDTAANMARMGYISFYIGDYDYSKEKLTEALSQQPNFSIPWLLLGKIKEKENKIEEAKLCFKKYNILMKGVFSLSSNDITNLDLFGKEQKYLEVDYASKFQDWYKSDFMY